MPLITQRTCRQSSLARQVTLAGLDRRGFQFGRHCVVETVQKAEQRDNRHDIDDLGLAVVFP
jgi:hypothetical protein